jgi:class II aldolase/adducin family protein
MNYRKAIVDAGIKLYNTKLVAGTSGNISIKENDDSFFITPSGMDYHKIKESDIVRIHADGRVYDNNQTPSSEWMMHLEVYKNYENYNAIVHTHSTIATAFAVSRVEIPIILIEMKPFLGGALKVAPFRPAGSKELAEVTIPYLKDANSCLLANHGVISCADTIDKALLSAEYVEDAAKIYYHSRLIGDPFILE